MKLRFSIKLLALPLAAVSLALSWASYAIAPVSRGSSDVVECVIERGLGGTAIARRLHDCGLIRSPLAFRITAWVFRVDDRLQAGTYLLSPGQSMREVLAALSEGRAKSDDITVTIPEGLNIWEIDKILTTAHLITPGQMVRQFLHKEGHLFPDTYRFAKDATLHDIVDKMEQTFAEKAATKSDIEIIFASMLEKEAKSADDMAMVAGIINKRMELGMPPQIDATVAYGWCVRLARPLCDVTQAPIITEIKVDGPYNTYTRRGLPRGPISNPGLKALNAAANPKKSDYLYYLSTRDGSKLIYSKTLSEHLKNRSKYLGF
jgi:peptidoglycan lytic transglycosylase G